MTTLDNQRFLSFQNYVFTLLFLNDLYFVFLILREKVPPITQILSIFLSKKL